MKGESERYKMKHGRDRGRKEGWKEEEGRGVGTFFPLNLLSRRGPLQQTPSLGTHLLWERSQLFRRGSIFGPHYSWRSEAAAGRSPVAFFKTLNGREKLSHAHLHL